MSKLALQKEMDQMLQRLVVHYEYDFKKVANSFAKYCNFLWDLYPNLSSSQIVDWKNEYTEDICRARFAMIRYQQDSQVKDTLQNVKQKQKPITQQEQLLNKLKEINPTKPSNFSVLDRNLKQEFEKRYESLRQVLPSTFDPNLRTEQDDAEVEAELQTLQLFLPKPATKFEQLLNAEKYQQQFDGEDVELDEQDLENLPDDLLQKEWETEYLRTKSTISELPAPSISLSIEHSAPTLSTTPFSPPKSPNRDYSRSSRRNRVYEHDSEDDN